MNGAQALIRTLVDAGVDVCFTNPGTSEMHFVAALDDVPEMRGDPRPVRGRGHRRGRRVRAHGRQAGRHAAAPRARPGQRPGQPAQRPHGALPMVNIVGDHATYHKQYDAPLESDIDDRRAQRVVAGSGASTTPDDVAADAADAVAAAIGPPGQVATLILPADVSWVDGAEPAPPGRRRRALGRSPTTSSTRVAKVARVGRAARCSSLGGRAMRERGARRGEPDRRRDRARSCCARRSRRGSSAAPGVPADRTARGTWPSSRRCSSRALEHLVARRRRGAGVVLRVSRQGERPRARRLRGPRAGAGAERRRRRARAPGRRASARRPTPRDRAGARRPDRPTGALTAETVARRGRRAAARGRDRRRRGATLGPVRPGRDRRRARARLAALTGGAIGIGLPARGRRRRRLPRSQGALPRRPTAGRCTRSRRCGRRRASSSTSPRSSSTTAATPC